MCLPLAGWINNTSHHSLRYLTKSKAIASNGRLIERVMTIQIFGKSKCFDTKKAERYFKERGVKFQSIDIAKYGMSKGEYQSVKVAVGGMEALFDKKSKEYENQYIEHLAREDDKEERLLANPAMFKTPIVRNGKKATVGYMPDVWKEWD